MIEALPRSTYEGSNKLLQWNRLTQIIKKENKRGRYGTNKQITVFVGGKLFEGLGPWSTTAAAVDMAANVSWYGIVDSLVCVTRVALWVRGVCDCFWTEFPIARAKQLQTHNNPYKPVDDFSNLNYIGLQPNKIFSIGNMKCNLVKITHTCH